jgi:hypothetical protein
MEKTKLLSSLLITAAIIISSLVLGGAFKNRNNYAQKIAVTGLGSRDFVSDLIVWSANFSRNSFELKNAYQSLNTDRELIKKYFSTKGVNEKEIIFSSVSLSKNFEELYDNQGRITSRKFSGYTLNQRVTVESKEVEKIENLSREVTELINQGVELYSEEPRYYYTQLASLKVEMISEATKDATERARKVAENAGNNLGNLKNASMGVFQIVGQNAGEDYSWGGTFNTSAKRKTASITVNCDFEIK